MNGSRGDRGSGRPGRLAPAVSVAGADERLRGAADQPAPADSLPRRLRAVYRRRAGPTEQSLLVAWAAFGVTFGLTRAVTHWIRAGHGPRGGGISAGGEHLHHYNIGIALLAGVGGVALRGQERHRRHPLTAAAYGSGTALIVDELALLLDLQDVYWANDGRTSVDAAVGLIAIGGVYLAAAPFWHAVGREVTRPRA